MENSFSNCRVFTHASIFIYIERGREREMGETIFSSSCMSAFQVLELTSFVSKGKEFGNKLGEHTKTLCITCLIFRIDMAPNKTPAE